jgi:hypothetical protein
MVKVRYPVRHVKRLKSTRRVTTQQRTDNTSSYAPKALELELVHPTQDNTVSQQTIIDIFSMKRIEETITILMFSRVYKIQVTLEEVY